MPARLQITRNISITRVLSVHLSRTMAAIMDHARQQRTLEADSSRPFLGRHWQRQAPWHPGPSPVLRTPCPPALHTACDATALPVAWWLGPGVHGAVAAWCRVTALPSTEAAMAPHGWCHAIRGRPWRPLFHFFPDIHAGRAGGREPVSLVYRDALLCPKLEGVSELWISYPLTDAETSQGE
jgi:hypothetical protein